MARLALLAALLLALVAPARAQEPDLPSTDEELRTAIEEAGSTDDHDGADAVMVLWSTRVEVEDSGLARIHERKVLKCLTEAGAARLARIRLDWDPASNDVQVTGLRVHRADGSTEELSGEAVVDLPQPQHGIYWGARMKLVPVPRLDPGDAVEISTRTKGFLIAYLADAPEGEERYIPPMRGHFYDIVRFSADVPVALRHYELRTPADKSLRYEVYNGEVQALAGFDETHRTRAFWKRDLPAFHLEPRAPGAADIQTKVVLATVPDWPAKSRWFFRVNESQFEATPEIRAKVEELTRGLRTDREKVAALVHWSADHIRYSGITMGEGEGYTLHTGQMVFHDRSGVCKDKASMAITMLRAAGYEAYAAMTMAGERVERVPADQFNHAVVAWRHEGEWVLLDPTWVPLSPEVWSSAEGEQHVLVGTEEGEELMVTPSFAPEDNALLVRSRFDLSADGTLGARVTLAGRGYAEQRLRRILVSYRPAHEREALAEEVARELGPGAEASASLPDYEEVLDWSEPIEVEVRATVPGYAAADGERMWVSPPSHRHLLTTTALAPYLDPALDAERTQPLLLWAPRQREATSELVLPRGWDVVQLPEDVHLEGPAASLDVTHELRGRVLRTSYRLVVPERTIPPEDHHQLMEVVDAAEALPRDLLVLERR